MHNDDFDTILTIAADRDDIGLFLSSTPTGKRGKFYDACNDKKLGFNEHHYPSTCNPNWGPTMEAEFRAQLTEQGWIHEVLAEFGTQESGVFDKAKIDKASVFEYYAYDHLDPIQQEKADRLGIEPDMYLFSNKATRNPLRTMGVKKVIRIVNYATIL